MGYRYRDYKIVTEDMAIEEANQNRAYNNDLLRNGVVGLPCLDIRPTYLWEKVDLISFVPAGCHVSSVELYEDGSANYFVRNSLEKVIGVLLYRPLTFP
jgi:hypothetical protein